MAISSQMLEAYGEKHLNKYSHWTYVLLCRNPYHEYEEAARKAEKRIDREPWWLRPAFEADKVKYIGQTEHLEKRLGQHLKQHNGSDFTTLFEPRRIVEIYPQYSRNSAEYEEWKITEQYKNKDDVFAWSDKS